MSGEAALFLASVAVYAGLPLLLTLRKTSFQFLLLYTHIAAVLTLGGFLGAIYVLPVLGGVSLLAGQVAYGGFMFATLLTVIVGRDLQVVRNIVALTVAVNVLVYLIFRVSNVALGKPRVPNPFDTSPGVFDQSLHVVLIGGFLIICELLAMLLILELVKSRVGTLPMAVVYVLTFVAVLTFDGVLFPTLVLFPADDLVPLVLASVKAKLVLAAVFAVPLAAFVVLYRPTVRSFEATPLHLRHLVSLSRDPLLDQLEDQGAQLVQSTAQVERATATVDRILDAATTTVLIASDPDLRITQFNRGAQELLGYSEQEVLGGTPKIFVSDEEIERQSVELGTRPDGLSLVAAQVRVGGHRDWQFTTRDGHSVDISLSITEIRVDEVLVGYLLAGEDVTTRLRVETALADALQMEQHSVARLEEANRVKDALVSTVSHELRTPLASIQGFTELLTDGSMGDLSPEQHDALSTVARNSARLQALVDDLIFVAKADASDLKVQLVPVDLCQVVASSRQTLAQQFRNRPDLELVYDLPTTAVTVRGDAPSLERLVDNLCSNAVKFTPDAGCVMIRVGQGDSGATLVVSDTGIGIDADVRAQLFQRFYRAPEANRRAIPGSGLGLSVVQEILRQHGGTIDLESRPGEGTTVTVRLPSA